MAAILKTVDLNGSNGSHFYIRLFYEKIVQTRNPKKSVVRFVLGVGSKDAYSGSGSACSCFINGLYVGSISSIPSYSENYLPGLEVEYEHDDDGECLANYSAGIIINWTGLATTDLAGSMELPKIWDNVVGVSKRLSSYYKDTNWGLRRFYFKENGIWKPAKVLYKQGSGWIG